MKENSYIPFGSKHREEIGKTVFIINSFADGNADKSAEQLILQLLESKINNNSIKEEIA